MLRISEVYTSIQGEGPGAGSPTQFVRFAGCNLKCPGWPCDTQHAIDPKLYRNEWETISPDTLLNHVESWPRAVTLTGGEPLLQNKDDLEEFAIRLLQLGYSIELFTNGTYLLPHWLSHQGIRTRIIMDWKLPDSGEDPDNETRITNLQYLRNRDAIKFVCASRRDFDSAREIAREYMLEGGRPQLYLGVAWGKLEEKELVEWMLKEQLRSDAWKLNVQVHNYIWPRDERAR
jgi:7-carboxy-7-deazaguanine synthase